MFEVETGLFFWTLISFGALLILLYKFALPPLIAMLNERKSTIEKSLKMAESAKIEAEKTTAEIRKQIEEIRRKVSDLAEKAAADAALLKEELLNKAKKEAHDYILKAEAEARHVYQKAVEKFRGEAADILSEATSRIIEKKMTKDDQIYIVEKVLTDMEKTDAR